MYVFRLVVTPSPYGLWLGIVRSGVSPNSQSFKTAGYLPFGGVALLLAAANAHDPIFDINNLLVVIYNKGYMMSIKQNLLNKKFGKLTVIEHTQAGWSCVCECGKSTIASDSHALTSGHKRSCGCIQKPHGRHGEKIYKIWKNMRARCNCPSSSGYHKYGGKGIKVCDRWADFKLFVEDMGEMPAEDYSIERINVYGNYEPSNCKWIPLSEQCWNKRNSQQNRKDKYPISNYPEKHF